MSIMSGYVWIRKHTQNIEKLPTHYLYQLPQNTQKYVLLQINTGCPLDSIQINTNKCGIKSFLTNTQILQEIQNEDTFVPSKNYNQRFSFGYKQNIIPILEYKNSEKLSQWKICNIHFQKANYICKNEAKFICNACISTNEHNLCDIMEYGELTKVMTSFTDQTYKIFEKIKEKSQNLTKSKLYQKILSQITKKKDKQIFNIKSFFQKLFQKLRKQQKILLQKLQNEAKQSIQSLKQTIKLRQSEIKNQDYRIEVHKLTSVMTQVYEYEGIQRALLYLNQSCQESQLIEKGRDLLQDLIHIDQGIKQKINLVGKRLQYCLDDKITESVQKIYSQKEPEKVIKSYQNIQTQVSKSLNFYLAYNFSVCQKLKNDISSLPFQTQISSEQLSQFKDQDFLLQSMNDIERNQGLTKNQITFQEHFSLIVPQSFQEEQFTPILRKEQDSMTVTDQTTITNIRNNQNYPFIQTQSSELTVIKRSHRQNSLIQNFMKSETTELEKTQIKDRTRSPLTPIRNGSHSKFRKNDIPQKYLPVWQAAKQDRCQNIDLTGAELGDTLILHLGSYLKDSKKIRFIKLIRNKLTDEIIFDLINCINQTNIISINLSQNSLTQKSLDVLENMNLGNLKSITLSQNKIVLRKVKDRIQRFKQKGITLTV